MSTTLARSERATDLFRGGLDDANGPVIVVDDRAVGKDGVDVSVLIDNACL